MICHTLRGPLLALLLSLSRENEGQDSCTELQALPASRTAGWSMEPGSNFNCSNTPQKSRIAWSSRLQRRDCGPWALSSSVQSEIKDFSPAVQNGTNSELLGSRCPSLASVAALYSRGTPRPQRCRMAVSHPAGMCRGGGRNWGRD